MTTAKTLVLPAALLAALALAGCEHRGTHETSQASDTAVTSAPAGLSKADAKAKACGEYHTDEKAVTKAWNEWNDAVPKSAPLNSDEAKPHIEKATKDITQAADKLQSELDDLGASLDADVKEKLTAFANTSLHAADDLTARKARADLDEDASYLAGASKDARAVCKAK